MPKTRILYQTARTPDGEKHPPTQDIMERRQQTVFGLYDSDFGLSRSVRAKQQRHLLYEDDLHVDREGHGLERGLPKGKHRWRFPYSYLTAGLKEHERNRHPARLQHTLP